MAGGDRGESPFTVGVHAGGDANVAPVFVVGEWQGDPEDVRELLEAAFVTLKGHLKLE